MRSANDISQLLLDNNISNEQINVEDSLDDFVSGFDLNAELDSLMVNNDEFLDKSIEESIEEINDDTSRLNKVLDTDFKNDFTKENLGDIITYSSQYSKDLDVVLKEEFEKIGFDNLVNEVEFVNTNVENVHQLIEETPIDEKEDLFIALDEIKRRNTYNYNDIVNAIQNNKNKKECLVEDINCIVTFEIDMDIPEFVKILAIKLMDYKSIIVDMNFVFMEKSNARIFAEELHDYVANGIVEQKIEFYNKHDSNYDLEKILIECTPREYDMKIESDLICSYGGLHVNKKIEEFNDDLYYKESDGDIYTTAKDADKFTQQVSSGLIGNRKILKGFRRKEKKLTYPVDMIENFIAELLEKNRIKEQIFEYFDLVLKLDINQACRNMTYKSFDHKNYKYSFDTNIMPLVNEFIEQKLKTCFTQELSELSKKTISLVKEYNDIKKVLPPSLINEHGSVLQRISEFKYDTIQDLPSEVKILLDRAETLEFAILKDKQMYMIKEEILCNVFEYIPLNDFQVRFDKINLIGYHYLCNYLEERITPAWESLGKKMVRGYRVKIETFRYELNKLILTYSPLRQFFLVVKHLIENWVKKTKIIGDYGEYFSEGMLSERIIEEEILRIMVLNVVRRKNPMVLRAVFSPYVHLIHKIISEHFLNKGVRKKYGHMKSMVYEDNENEEYFLKKRAVNINITMVDEIIKAYIQEHPRLRNSKLNLIKRLGVSKLFEADRIDLLNRCPQNFSILDWQTKLHILKDSNFVKDFRVNTKFIKTNLYQTNYPLVKLMVSDALFPIYRQFIPTNRIVEQTIGTVSYELSKYIHSNNYIGDDFKLKFKSNEDSLNTLSDVLHKLKEASTTK